jgi:hypothetical protein
MKTHAGRFVHAMTLLFAMTSFVFARANTDILPPPNTFSIFKSPQAGLPLQAGKRPSNELLFEKMYDARITNGHYTVAQDGTVSVTGDKNGTLQFSDGIQLAGLDELSIRINIPDENTHCMLELEIRFDQPLSGKRAPFRKKINPGQGSFAFNQWETIKLLGRDELPDGLDVVAARREGGGIFLKVSGFSEKSPIRFEPMIATFAGGRTQSLYNINETANIYSTSLRLHNKKPYKPAPWVIIGGGATSPGFARHLKQYWPHIGVTYPGSIPRLDTLADTLAIEGIRVLFEDTPWLFNQKKHLWQEAAAQFDQNGTPWIGMHHANIFLPSAFAAARDVIDYAARAGRDSVVLADWIWPWHGRFGFDPVSIAAFRSILHETDEGILLTFAEGKQRWRFWDYFDYYHAFRWTPSDPGYQSWDDFEPLDESVASQGGVLEKKRFLLYTALYHYAHLRFTQKMGLYAHDKGLRFELIPNPEEAGNGNDFLLFARLDGVDNIFAEYFYVPESMMPGYYNLGYIDRAARETGFDLSLQLETGFGGGISHYFASENYLPFAWLLTAGGNAAQLKIDFLTDADVHSRNPDDPRHEHYRRIRFMLHGFQLAREDRARKPETPVMNIQRRSIHNQFTGFDIGLRGTGNFGAALAENNIAFDGWGQEEADRHLGDYKTVFLGGWQSTTRLMQALSEWLDGDNERLLITHSAVPFEIDEGIYNVRTGIHWASWQNMVYFADWMLKPLVADGENRVLNIRAQCITDVSLPPHAILRSGKEKKELSTTIPPLDYWVTQQGEPLILLGDKPLVSLSRRANGSRIVYFHYTPGREHTRHLDHAVMDMLGNQLHLARNGHSERYYILPAKIEGGFAYALHDRIASYDFSMTHNLFGKNPKTYLYPWRNNEKKSELVLNARPDTGYLFYDWLGDREGVVTSDADGKCTLHYGGVNTGLLYLLENNKHGQDRLVMLKNLRSGCHDILANKRP